MSDDNTNTESDEKRPTDTQKKTWLDQNQRWIKICVVILTLIVAGTNVYFRGQQDINSFSDPFGPEREPDLTDDRFEEYWIKTFAGKWENLDEGGFVEFTPNNQIIITSPDGEVEVRYYGYTFPSVNAGQLIVTWGQLEDSRLPAYSGHLGVGLVGEGRARTGGVALSRRDGEIDVKDDMGWRLKRVDLPQPIVPNAESVGKSYLVYNCGGYSSVEYPEVGEVALYGVCIANPDGSNARKVTTDQIGATDDFLAVDGAGRVLFNCYFSGASSELCVTEPDGGAIHPLGLDRNYAHSFMKVNNRGQAISMCVDLRADIRSRTSQICAFDLDGSDFSVLTNDRGSRIRRYDDFELSINEAGEYVFRCFERANSRETELCYHDDEGRLIELTSEREQPRFFYDSYAVAPDRSVIYTCSEETDVGQICRFDTETGERESLTYWAGMPYWSFQDIDVNNRGQIVFRCWNNSIRGQHICGAKLGKPGFWDLTPSPGNFSFSFPRINNAGEIVANCVEETNSERLRRGLCKISSDERAFEWMDLDEPITLAYGWGDSFFLSR